jgi:hypothetical protein
MPKIKMSQVLQQRVRSKDEFSCGVGAQRGRHGGGKSRDKCADGERDNDPKPGRHRPNETKMSDRANYDWRS